LHQGAHHPKGSAAKPVMALEELDRVRALGVRFGFVVADTGYGDSAAFCCAALRVAKG